MKGRGIPYTTEELAWIEARRAMPRRDLHVAFWEHFGRGDVSLVHIKSLCTRNGWITRRSGHFEKGATPFNKGKKMAFNANSARTQFKKGIVPANTKPMFHERIGKDDYIEMKVPVSNPYTGAASRYMHKHRYLWEQIHGPVPAGYVLKSRDGNRQNTDPSNWTLISRSLLPSLSGRRDRGVLGYDAAEPEVRPLIMASAELRQRARKARRGETRG